MDTQTVIVERLGAVGKLTLNRPDRLNAFNEEQHLALRAALEAAAADPDVGTILLTGAGRGFCAGQDLGERDPAKMGAAPDLGHTLDTFYNPLIRLIRSIEKPVVCAVNGVAAGAGANIAFACDIVLAAKSAKFIQAFAKIGLVPDCGGTFTVTRLIGEARAKALMMTGAPVSADDAAAWGLIWRAVDDAALAEEVETLAKQLADGATFGLALTKRAIQSAATNTLNDQLDLERDLQRIAGQSPEYAEGVRAFLEKRAPDFRRARQNVKEG